MKKTIKSKGTFKWT